ncbi:MULTISPECIES: hypothetical protein [Streptacidiphilus]|uniref:Transposase IS701-like DDE domain-containing protein n=1 Tax=Streptacidiphilus cavernicola TaxID=3342716 RepID=A0ABV6UL94_9ACTN|nr:hypothetical protein [Streptacidiphilus jeojiense]
MAVSPGEYGAPGLRRLTLAQHAVRLGPVDDAIAITAAQLREMGGRLIEAGHRQAGDPDILLVMDAGFDVTGHTGHAWG